MKSWRYNISTRFVESSHKVYSLSYHAVWVTKYRRRIQNPDVVDYLKKLFCKLIRSIPKGELEEIRFDKDHVHFLIGYNTTDRVCDIVKIIKQQTTHYLWQKYSNFLSKQYWKKKIFWSDGYFACSIGEVSSATIQKYIESQG